MPPVTVKQMQELLVIMSRMKHSATNHDWQELARLDSERLALLKYDSGKAPNSDIEEQQSQRDISDGSGIEVKELRVSLINQILALDEEIMSSLRADRRALLDKNRGLSAQVEAKSVYAQNELISY